MDRTLSVGFSLRFTSAAAIDRALPSLGPRIAWTASGSELIGRCITGTGTAAIGGGWPMDLRKDPGQSWPRFLVRCWFSRGNIVWPFSARGAERKLPRDT